MASVIAAGTSYATHGEAMIPVYVFYSMFGFQRTGDQMWSFGDQLGRGFLLGATAGRTTLNGEGLQHQDGHSLLLASTNPAVVAYDPAFGYEVAFIVEDGLRRMYGEQPEDVFYYLTVYNEPYPQPAMPDVPDLQEGVLGGMYRYRPGSGEGPRAQVLASGVTVRLALDAQRLLRDDWGVVADIWSVTSWNELRRDAVACEQDALLDPSSRRTPFVTRQLEGAPGPVVAVSDWMRAVPDMISRWVPQDWSSLGTDGYGRSDTRAALRRHFHIDPESIALGVLNALAARGEVAGDVPARAVEQYGLRCGAGRAAEGQPGGQQRGQRLGATRTTRGREQSLPAPRGVLSARGGPSGRSGRRRGRARSRRLPRPAVPPPPPLAREDDGQDQQAREQRRDPSAAPTVAGSSRRRP